MKCLKTTTSIMACKTKFKVGEQIVEPNKTQILEIEFIDFTRNVYIFKREWIHSLTKFKSYDISVIDSKFIKSF